MSNHKQPTISVVIPTYNEAENLTILIPLLGKVLKNISHEIIIADDNSPDGTYDAALGLKKKFPQIRALCRTHNRGLSPAVMDGFQIAQGKYLIVMDADLQHDEKILPEIVARFENGAELVVASRKIPGGGFGDWSRLRRFISWGASFLAHILFPRLPSDPMSGYFGLTSDLFRKIAPDINPRGFKILLEIVTKSPKINIAEVGYVFRNREFGESKLSSTVMLNYLIALAELRFGGLFSREYLQFVLVGAIGILVNTGFFWLARHLFTLTDEKALLIGIEVAIICNFFVNNMFTFRDSMLRGFLGVLKGFIYFQTVCFLGAYINYAIALHLSHFLSLNIYLANTIGIIIASFWNYFLNAYVIWRRT